MLNGYPVSHLSGEYDENLPYANRDPRLEAYILYNGCKAGNTNKEIFTAADGTTNDALNKVVGRSTRTGYYLRKLLRQDISLDPNAKADQYHYTPRIRYTEIFLAYAEAANQAYGPQDKGGNGYSAYDVVKSCATVPASVATMVMLTWNPSRTIRQRWRNSSATNVASNFVSKVSVSGICAAGRAI